MPPIVCVSRPWADNGHPESALASSDQQYLVLPKHIVLHRIHLTNLGAAQFNPGRGGQTGFASFHDSAGRPVPSLPADASLCAAIHETISHDIPASVQDKSVRLNEVQTRTHFELRTKLELQLVELRNVNLGGWGISRDDLISSPLTLYGPAGTSCRLDTVIPLISISWVDSGLQLYWNHLDWLHLQSVEDLCR